MSNEAYSHPYPDPEPHATFATSAATPINLLLLTVFVILVYLKLRPSPPPLLNQPSRAVVFRTYTPRTLLPFNGTGGSPVYLAVNRSVYDVTPGKMFYGPGGPYANFAGHDASRGLAMGSFDEDMLTKDLDGPLDALDDLGEQEREALAGWEETFSGKYQRVGKLVRVGEEAGARDGDGKLVTTEEIKKQS